jgi:hypothetical protein
LKYGNARTFDQQGIALAGVIVGVLALVFQVLTQRRDR